MKIFLYGYGSLINIESASRTLKRDLTRKEVKTGILRGYERNWTVWDNVISNELEKQVKAVFLNVMPEKNAFLNGVLIEVSNDELEYFIVREKNYVYTEITQHVTLDEKTPYYDFKIFTFVGKIENLIEQNTEDYFIFNRYIDIVNVGVKSFGDTFSSIFDDTTKPSNFPKLSGTYTFVDSAQQKAC